MAGGFVRRTVASFLHRRLRICFVRGEVSTRGVTRRILVGVHSHIGTRSAELGVGGALRDNGDVASEVRGFISYHSGSISRHRVFVIRNSSTLNTYGRTESDTFRTIVPMQKGVLGYLGTRCPGVFGGSVVASLVGILNYNIRMDSGTGGGLSLFGVSGLH